MTRPASGSPGRVLIDWDYAAHGLWLVRAPESPSRLAWRDLLSAELLEALSQWNRDCEVSSRQDTSPARTGELQERARQLGREVQRQLGQGWEVLYAEGGAWSWVDEPITWPRRPI